MAGPLLTHWMKNIGLILLSILFLPIDSLILVATLLFHRVFPSNQPYASPKDRELVALVAGHDALSNPHAERHDLARSWDGSLRPWLALWSFLVVCLGLSCWAGALF